MTLSAWLVDDDESMRWVLERALTDAGITARSFAGGVELLDALEQAQPGPDVLFTDVRMPGISGLDLLERVHALAPALPIIIMTAHSDLDSAVAAYRGGAFEYLPKPFDLDAAVELVQRAANAADDGQAQATEPARPAQQIIGEAPAMQEVFRAIGRLSHSHITALITGESGTGKELVARALHENSPRAQRPFIAVNTAAIPKDLMESEFFGHEKGAFTGAAGQRRGRFEQAHGGTLFLDEIGDMPASLQTRLLRVLQDGQFYRVGGHAPVSVDVRILAATHQHLEDKVAAGSFREDLFHRINVIRLRVPALRERREDIPALLECFMARAGAELDTQTKRLHADVVAHLSTRPWPGNVRQLENLCRWLTVMAPGRDVRLDDLPPEVGRGAEDDTAAAAPGTDWAGPLERWARQRLDDGVENLLFEAQPAFEKAMITAALARTGGRRQAAARLLGWGRNTLTRKIRELDLPE